MIERHHLHPHDDSEKVNISRGTFDLMTSELDSLRKRELEFELAQARIKELERMDTEHTLQITRMNGYIGVLEETLERHGIALPQAPEGK